MILFRGVVELLRALADGVELGLSVISPLDIPAQPEEEPRDFAAEHEARLAMNKQWQASKSSPAGTGSASAAGSGDEVPAGVGPPTTPAGHPDPAICEVAAQQLRLAAQDMPFRKYVYWNWIADELTTK